MQVQANEIQFILSTSEIGAGTPGASMGPQAIMDILSANGFIPQAIEISTSQEEAEAGDDTNHPYAKNIDWVLRHMDKLQAAVAQSAHKSTNTLILSGDHSNAIGSISGFVEANKDKIVGVIWVDAHADMHSPLTTPSGNMHGMPLAALLDTDNKRQAVNSPGATDLEKWNQLKRLGPSRIHPKIQGENIVFIALRDAEEQEWELIESLGVKYFRPEAIESKGIKNVLEETIEHLKNCDTIYVSFDVDSMDPSVSCGTGTPVDKGLSLIEAQVVFDTLFFKNKVNAFEITEVNPSLDADGPQMAEIASGLLLSQLK